MNDTEVKDFGERPFRAEYITYNHEDDITELRSKLAKQEFHLQRLLDALICYTVVSAAAIVWLIHFVLNNK